MPSAGAVEAAISRPGDADRAAPGGFSNRENTARFACVADTAGQLLRWGAKLRNPAARLKTTALEILSRDTRSRLPVRLFDYGRGRGDNGSHGPGDGAAAPSSAVAGGPALWSARSLCGERE